MNGTAFYGGKKFSSRISNASFGNIFDCTLTELKENIKTLRERKYTVYKRKY